MKVENCTNVVKLHYENKIYFLKLAVIKMIITSTNTSVLRLAGKYQIPTNSIVYLESEWNYTNVYTSDNKKHISSFTLKILEARIVEKDFLRVNRGSLVNLNHIKEIKGLKRNAQVELSNGSVLTISRRKYEALKDRMAQKTQIDSLKISPFNKNNDSEGISQVNV